MKKLLLIAVAALVIISCSKKSNPIPKSVDLKTGIVATWTAKADTEVITKDGVYWHTYPVPGYISLTFKSDGTGTKVWDDGPRNFAYTITGKTITFNFERVDYADGSYSPAFSENLEAKTITSSNLVLIYQDDVTQDGSLYHTIETQQFSK